VGGRKGLLEGCQKLRHLVRKKGGGGKRQAVRTCGGKEGAKFIATLRGKKKKHCFGGGGVRASHSD